VRLLGFDGQRMLLEPAGERHLSEELEAHGDRSATEIAAQVMARLLSPSDRPVPPDLQPLALRFDALFAKARADRDAGLESAYIDAAEVAHRLLSNQRDVRPLHGDLHHENIMSGPRGWLAIDAKGVLGDPAFDAANLFYNPLERTELCLEPERIAMMAAMFSRALKMDERHLLDHAFAYGCLSAAWHEGDRNHDDEQRELAIAAAVRAVRS
jgi:streptomycin 6-kinase